MSLTSPDCLLADWLADHVVALLRFGANATMDFRAFRDCMSLMPPCWPVNPLPLFELLMVLLTVSFACLPCQVVTLAVSLDRRSLFLARHARGHSPICRRITVRGLRIGNSQVVFISRRRDGLRQVTALPSKWREYFGTRQAEKAERAAKAHADSKEGKTKPFAALPYPALPFDALTATWYARALACMPGSPDSSMWCLVQGGASGRS